MSADGKRAVKKPIIPESLLNAGATPHEEIVIVPEDAETVADLSLVVGDGDLTISGDTVGTDGTDDVSTQSTDDLEVPGRAAALLALLRADGDDEPWTAAAAHAVAHESDDEDLQVGDRTIRKYLKALADAGALEKTEGDGPTDPNEYRLG